MEKGMSEGLADIREMLRNEALRDSWTDDADCNIVDNSGGNFDDAYWAGRKDGRTDLARELFAKLWPEEKL